MSIPDYNAVTFTRKGGPLSRAEFEKNFTDLEAAAKAVASRGLFRDAAGRVTVGGQLVPIPPRSYRLAGSRAKPASTLDHLRTDSLRFATPWEILIPVEAQAQGSKVTIRATVTRKGANAFWASLNVGPSGGPADPPLTAIELTTAWADGATVVLTSEIDFGGDGYAASATTRHVKGAGDSFTHVDLSAAGLVPWYVSVCSRASTASSTDLSQLLNLDVAIFP